MLINMEKSYNRLWLGAFNIQIYISTRACHPYALNYKFHAVQRIFENYKMLAVFEILLFPMKIIRATFIQYHRDIPTLTIRFSLFLDWILFHFYFNNAELQ